MAVYSELQPIPVFMMFPWKTPVRVEVPSHDNPPPVIRSYISLYPPHLLVFMVVLQHIATDPQHIHTTLNYRACSNLFSIFFISFHFISFHPWFPSKKKGVFPAEAGSPAPSAPWASAATRAAPATGPNAPRCARRWRRWCCGMPGHRWREELGDGWIDGNIYIYILLCKTTYIYICILIYIYVCVCVVICVYI